MTICIAALCQWNYGTLQEPDWGAAIVTAADRMLTDAGLEIQYEGGQGKWAHFGKRVIVFVADSLPIQSEILRQLGLYLGNDEDVTAREVADCYSEAVIKYKRDEAEKIFLAPYGLTMESFSEVMQTSTNTLISDLAQQILDHGIAVEAVVAGLTEDGIPSIYHIDNRGITTSHVDVGFVSVGSGHSHSNAWLMSRGYWNRWRFYDAVCAVYAAKAQAENAPGVGKGTDMHLITRDGWRHLDPEIANALVAEFPLYKKQLAKLEGRMVQNIWKRTGKAIEKNQTAALPRTGEITSEE